MIIKPRLCEFSDPIIPISEMQSFYSLDSIESQSLHLPYSWSNSIITLDGIMHFKDESLISDISLAGFSENSIADYRLLNFGWAMADAVLFSGQILRDEPHTSCQINYHDIISFRRSIGKATDHPIQLILSKECNFPLDHAVFSSNLQIIVLTSQIGKNNLLSGLDEAFKKNVTVKVVEDDQPLEKILQKLKSENSINVIQLF